MSSVDSAAPPATLSTTLNLSSNEPPIPILSKRGEKALQCPPLLKCAIFDNQYSPSNPLGMINIGVAENSLMTDWIIAYYQEKQIQLTYSDFTYGSALGGSIRLFAALQKLFSTYFHARIPVLRDHIIAGSGCGSVIDLLVSCLADPGDGILVAKPFYNGFSASFECRNNVVPVGVDLPEGEEGSIVAIEYFERALVESEKNGRKIRAVMLCNPNNPLGFCYSKEVLMEYCHFAERYNIHLIVDEIYALSTFPTLDNPTSVPFTSILSLDPSLVPCNPSRIHAIYGASKDWGCNGLRIGALISQHNEELHRAMESSCLLMKISSAADALWSGLLLDPVGLPMYIKENQARLASAYTLATNFLSVHKIPYRPSNAGHFIFVDLRRFLICCDEEGKELIGMEKEEELANRFAKGGVIIARGAAYAYQTPGFFRLTFALRRDYFELALARVEKVLGLRETKSVDLVRVAAGDADEIEEMLEGVTLAV